MPVFLFFEGFCNILHQNADPEVLRTLFLTAVTVDAVVGAFFLAFVFCADGLDAFALRPVVEFEQQWDVDFYHTRYAALAAGTGDQRFCSILLHREVPPFSLFSVFLL